MVKDFFHRQQLYKPNLFSPNKTYLILIFLREFIHFPKALIPRTNKIRTSLRQGFDRLRENGSQIWLSINLTNGRLKTFGLFPTHLMMKLWDEKLLSKRMMVIFFGTLVIQLTPGNEAETWSHVGYPKAGSPKILFQKSIFLVHHISFEGCNGWILSGWLAHLVWFHSILWGTRLSFFKLSFFQNHLRDLRMG